MTIWTDLGISEDEVIEELHRSAAVKAERVSTAKQMVSHAKSISPVRTGRYAASWKVSSGKGPDGDVSVVNRNFEAHFIEDGTPTIHEHAVAAKTAIAFGGTAGDVLKGKDA